MYANHSIHPSFIALEMREHLSNVHSEGGNLIFADGHAEYRKYYDLRSGDFGLAPDELYEPTLDQTYQSWDSAF
jgi:prepilin-type processing-associated H-X9-DG protein